jgi:methyl-accepting chemotaxis protein
MSNRFRARISVKLGALVAVCLAAFAAFVVLAFTTFERVRVEGAYYRKIIEAKDVVADILPPPLFIVESYLLAFEQLYEKNPTQFADLVRQSEALEHDYRLRHDHWMANLPQSEMRQRLVVDADKPAREFFKLWHDEFLPMRQSGNLEGAQAVLAGRMRTLYNAHREVILDVVCAADDTSIQLQKNATTLYLRGRAGLVAGVVLGTAVMVLLSVLIGRSIRRTLSTSVNAVARSASQIATAVEQQERVAMEQSGSVTNIASTMEELSASFRQTGVFTAEVVEREERSLGLATDVMAMIRTTVSGIEDVLESVRAISQKIALLGEQTNQIGGVSLFVKTVSSQTNMLALNATVEAARSGEHERGFAVIAGEIRKLAAESRRATERIDTLVAAIQSAMNEAVRVADEGVQRGNEGIIVAQRTHESVTRLSEALETSYRNVKQTVLHIQQQVAAVQQVTDAMETINMGARQNADGMTMMREELRSLERVANTLAALV